MTAVGMNNLWNYIQGLSLSAKNQAWLAARLTEASLHQKTKNKKKKLSKEIEAIPEEYRCDPYEISPSGDPFFADKRNVEELRSLPQPRLYHEEIRAEREPQRIVILCAL